MYKLKKKLLYTVITLLTLIIAGAFLLFIINNKKHSDEHTIRMAVPIMSASAPLFIISEFNLMDKYLPNSKLELIVIESGNAMNEAMIANQIDGMITGLINFLFGANRNVPYKIFTSLSYSRSSIQTNESDIKSIYDVRNHHLIGINGLTGTVALLLSFTAEKYFGSFDALNNQIVIMSPDDITLALINKTGISLAFSDITGRVIQNKFGNPTILEDTELFNERVFTHYVIFNEKFLTENKELISAFYLALSESVKLINNRDDAALEVISKNFRIEKETLVEFLEKGFLVFELDNFDSIDILTDMAIKMGLISTRKPLKEMVSR